ncbi:MAG TPA: glycosyltransferase family 4 protein [Anaerolineales bacterium]
MRILFITAFYPPYIVGGWEQLVQDINTRLQGRGYTTQVLTSTYGVGAASQEPGVERALILDSDVVHYRPLDFFLNRHNTLEHNLSVTRAAITRFHPDVVFVHVMWNLSKAIPWQAEQLCPGKVVYYIANDWPYAPDNHTLYWRDPAQRSGRKLVKLLLAPLALKAIERESEAFPLEFKHVLCVSQAVQRDLTRFAAIPAENLQVVYNGVEVEQFTPAEPARGEGGDVSLLYAGSLVPHKGVHTALEAMALLARRPLPCKVTLTLVGAGHPDYEAHLKKMVQESGIEGQVSFWGRVPREEMPAVLRKFDVLVFPSIWQEPLSRGMQEAMAAGLVVVGTTTGGTTEILIDGETGLTFEAENAAELASRLEQLCRDAPLRKRLSENARKVILEKFDLQRMINEIEAALQQVTGAPQAGEAQFDPQPEPALE